MTNQTQKTVFICYPNEDYRSALTKALLIATDQVQIVGECSSIVELPKFIETYQPDFILIGFAASEQQDFEILRDLPKTYSSSAIVVLSFYYSKAYKRMIMETGALTLLPSHSLPSEILEVMSIKTLSGTSNQLNHNNSIKHNAMNNERLVLQLIQQDLKHHQLTLGLNRLGLDDTGLHCLDILSIVAELMKIPEGKLHDKWDRIYISFMHQAQEYKISGRGEELKPLAEKCYQMLIDCVEIENRIDS